MKNVLEEVEKRIIDALETNEGHYLEVDILGERLCILIARPENFEATPEWDVDEGPVVKH